jgi:hypothetical protein
MELQYGCLLYAGAFAFTLLVHYGRTFQGWDEFSHWGFIVKHFHTVDALGTIKHPNYDISFPAYFPGTSLFQYFFSRFSGQFTEWYLYIAMNIMYFSSAMPFVKNLFSKNKWKYQLIVLTVFFLLPMMFSMFYMELYVDTILGFFFGFSFLNYFLYRYEESYGTLMIAATLFMLTLTKDMGLLFSLIVLGIIAVDITLFRRSQIKSLFAQQAGLKYKAKKSLLLIFPLLNVLFVKLSWTNLLNRGNVKSIWYIPTLNDIYRFFTGRLEQYQKEARYSFFFAMFKRKIPDLNVSVVEFVIIFAVVVLVVAFIYREKFNFHRMTVSALLLVIGLFGYQFILALMYTFSFGIYEGLRLKSYERYAATYLVGMMLFIMIFYAAGQNERKHIKLTTLNELASSEKPITYKDIFSFGKTCVSILICAIFFFMILNFAKAKIFHTILGRITQSESFKPRPTAIAAEKWKPYFEKENPYFIDQGSNGFSYNRMKYELIPYSKLANTRLDYSISTKPYYTDDPWTFIVTPDEWEQHILTCGYKLLYVYKSDEILETTYGQFFPYGVQDDMLYNVQYEDGYLLLLPVYTKESSR